MDVFDALADPVRRDLLVRIDEQPRTVNELAAAHAISRPAVSRHLRVLREVGLVTVTASGRTRVHELDRAALGPVEALLGALTHGPRIADHQLDALELEVRRTVRERRHRSQPDAGTGPERREDTR